MLFARKIDGSSKKGGRSEYADSNSRREYASVGPADFVHASRLNKRKTNRFPSPVAPRVSSYGHRVLGRTVRIGK